ncbi:O-mannosyltransferase [Sparassis latifolia]|uniref:Dolichyl-phosphate-mannose--protein mannosyltransferase n=1 Tax=Sparassis crispa TaxID=139825 RepID=A0A401GW39_9APHY|nr:Dolichyl-phosphate-mannose--protein mannosyltransferase 4 [Sparassis crispa]GBE86447.1 Dolichyl-phosphate-mannose--protein mannosyltransferase 4 [Sparassis crispa]
MSASTSSTSPPGPLRNRRHVTALDSPRAVEVDDDRDEHLADYHVKNRSYIEILLESEEASMVVVAVLTALSFALRFYKINWPDQVVFDEVHFGKFASYYILREYYFDVHPPLAKMLFGLAGWFVGYDGHFMFENIGDSYLENHVPYVGLRALPAILGSLTVPIVYAIMKECGYSTVVAIFSASIILLDNAHIAQSRLILLDATLIFFMSLTLYSYIRFRKLRFLEFSPEWWGWLLATGTFMACTWASKVNGVLTVVAIGIAVLVDLWDLLDQRNSMDYFWKHFMARAVGLIVLPIFLYLLFFYIHLSILVKTGPGDTFMSPAFQETLIGNELLLNSQEIRYYDTVTIKHKDTRVFLHSHPEVYPLKYEDGRISSQGQQVTGYGHDDSNNNWQIIPTKALPETGRGRIVRHDDVIQLLHVNTQSYLLTHDVASPLMPTNEEFTTWPKDDLSRYNDTQFELRIVDGHEGDSWKSKSGHFRLIHVPTKVAMWTHSKQLPEWAFSQQEINGNKNVNDKTAVWFIDNIVADETGEDLRQRTGDIPPKPPKKMNFFKKFAELQLLMLQHNAGLTASHPYASTPINWPFLLSGISFWTESNDQKQIYLIGNLIGWWMCVVSLSIYVGIVGGDLVMRRRGENPLSDPVRNRMWNSTGFFFVVWAVHYFPFFLMSRQLFIHHYLPSHLASALVAGSVLSFVLSEEVNYPVSTRGPLLLHPKQARKADLGVKGPVVVGLSILLLLILFVYISPLTYGTPGLDGDAVNRRRLLSGWTLHFAGKPTD